MNLKKKVVIVTGSNGRIGEQVVQDLIKEEAIVVSCDITKIKKKKLNNFFKLDITDENNVKSFLDNIKKKI